MGMATSERIYYTADMVRELNAAEPRQWPRYECVYGEMLVTPAPAWPHQIVAARLHTSLATYITANRVPATALFPPADISWGRDDVTLQPDVFVLPAEATRDLWRSRSWAGIRRLLLVAEVLSPSTRHADRFRKRLLYQEERVPLYWIVDPETRSAEVWTPDAHFPAIERETLVWHPDGAAEPFTCALADLLAEP